MRISRLFVDTGLAQGAVLTLPEPAARRLREVLRMRPGETLELFNGTGGAWAARVLSLARREATVEVGAFDPTERESGLAVTLAQGISRGSHMDYTLQKSVELGVHGIVPLFTERSNVRLDAERAATRMQHWRNVLIGACEQCGRNRLPALSPPVALEEWIRSDPAPLKVMLDAAAAGTLASIAGRPPALTLLAGPEGGLAPEEKARARAAGYEAVRLGPRILRTESAAVAALAICQHRWGDL
jgi:16S rRNA (uracil1498-N3)-methyltransferase